MYSKIVALVIALCSFVVPAMAQKTDMPHASPEAKAKARIRSEYSSFRRQINALKELADERKKIPVLQKENKAKVTVVATIDSVETDDSAKTLMGYITQTVGDNSSNIYEVVFDRATKKITAIKKTGEGIEPEQQEAKPKTAAKPATTATKKPVAKKTSEDEEEGGDEEEEEEKGSKKKDKEEE